MTRQILLYRYPFFQTDMSVRYQVSTNGYYEYHKRMRKANRRCQMCGQQTKKRCPKCTESYFCSQNCFKKGWPEHKKLCATIKSGDGNAESKLFRLIMGTVVAHSLLEPDSPLAIDGMIWELVGRTEPNFDTAGKMITDGIFVFRNMEWIEFQEATHNAEWSRGILGRFPKEWYAVHQKALSKGERILCNWSVEGCHGIGIIKNSKK